jgi:peptidyl-prolyl cis-trans isomerase B (cyclophilin B)
MRLFAALVASCLLLSGTANAAGKAQPKETKPQLGRTVVIETNKGTIEFGLYEKDAPITSKNFAELVQKKFYDGLTFHRVVPDFVIQGGDPNGDGSGGSSKTIPLEVSPKLKHDAAGVVAMARTSDPNSASSQFYITLSAKPHLDMQYAVFGRVTKGLDVVNKIEVGDVMKKVYFKPAPKPKSAAPKAAPKHK